MKIAFYGDSTIWGLDGEKFVQTGQNLRADHPLTDYIFSPIGFTAINKGVKSTTATQLLNGDGVNLPWCQEMCASDADVVVINHCLNDSVGGDFALYVASMRSLRDIASNHGKVVILMSPAHCSVANAAQNVLNMQAIASEAGIPYFNVWGFTEPMAGHTPDGVHPDQFLYRQIGMQVSWWLNEYWH